MLLVFVTGLSAFRLGGAGMIDSFVAARLLVFLCFFVGILSALLPRRSLFAGHSPLRSEELRLKVLAVRVGLVSLLLFPMLMACLFSSWPTGVFNFEYLLILPFLLLLAPYYVGWVEKRMPQGEDGYLRFGLALTRRRPWCWSEHRELVFAWGVKLFFIPLMYVWLIAAVEEMLSFSWVLHPAKIVAGLFTFGLCVDLLIATSGYFFASRLLGNDIRSTDKTWLGWLSCIMCYPPLLSILHMIKQQRDDMVWTDWLQPDSPLYWVWAILITLSWMIYWLASISFGLKFSNLSWRGLVDDGPYRYTKHPGYLSKNVYWWLHTVPFFGILSSFDLVRNLAGLAFVSFVYYLRAKTEERHLMIFPEYVAYALRIERHGVFARLGRIAGLR